LDRRVLIGRIEAKVADENSSASGFGLLSVMNDYGPDPARALVMTGGSFA
jgi:hypothetical protein